LNHRNRAQTVRDRKPCILEIFAAAILGEIIATRPGAACTEGMESSEPGKLRKGDVGVALLPRGGGFMGEIAEQTTVRGEIGTAWKDASA
jgi:hypothetical protein